MSEQRKQERFPAATIQVEPEFRLKSRSFSFYNDCLGFAQKLQNVLDGGVSVKFFGRIMTHPVACFWWRGKEIARLFFESSTVDTGLFTAKVGSDIVRPAEEKVSSADIWKRVFRPGILEIISKEEKRLGDLRTKITHARWDNISEESSG